MTAYHEIKAMNWSRLVSIEDSPLMYQWREDHERPDTPSLAFGRAIHCGIMEPDDFGRRHPVPEVGPCRATTKKGDPCGNNALPGASYCGIHGGKGEAEAWIASLGPDAEPITADQRETVELIVERIHAHQDAGRLLEGTRVEAACTWTDPATGVLCKGRMDSIAPDRLIDIKSCHDMAIFPREVARYNYHGQVAWYRDGAVAAGVLSESAEVYLLVVETSEPYDVAVFRVGFDALEAGRRLWKRLLGLWLECERSGVWPGRHPAITDLELPRWASGMIDEGW